MLATLIPEKHTHEFQEKIQRDAWHHNENQMFSMQSITELLVWSLRYGTHQTSCSFQRMPQLFQTHSIHQRCCLGTSNPFSCTGILVSRLLEFALLLITVFWICYNFNSMRKETKKVINYLIQNTFQIDLTARNLVLDKRVNKKLLLCKKAKRCATVSWP